MNPMNQFEESNFCFCAQCNQRVLSYPNQFCRRRFHPSFQQFHSNITCNIQIDQTDIINENESIYNRTSGNSKLDELIEETQLNSKCCDDFIEWISFSNLDDIKFLTNGGNSSIYSGTWSLNTSLTSKQSIKIVLKVISDSENVNDDILNEFKMHHKCRSQCIIPFYGITNAPKGDEYAMVIRHAEHGDLRNYIRKFFSRLTWTNKVEILIKLSKALNALHKMNLLHRDFHCKNILVDEEDRIFINDFGLCQPLDSEIVSNSIRGVLPYIAPEVLRNKPYTKQSEVYSISMIMWELTSNKPPFTDYFHDADLALAVVIHEFRPEIIDGTPGFYAEFMQKCWDSDPLKRPDVSLLPQMFEEMVELCEIFDNVTDSSLSYFSSSPKPDLVISSNENNTGSGYIYITEAYKYSLGKVSINSISSDLQICPVDFIEEKKVTEELSIELTKKLQYNRKQSVDINSSSSIEDKIVKKFDNERFKKTKYKKNSVDEKQAQKLRKFQKANKLRKKSKNINRKLEIQEKNYEIDTSEDEISSQVSEEDPRYTTQTYNFSFDDLKKTFYELKL